MLSDEYGWPVTSDKNVELVITVDTNECDQYTANEQLGYGINYILEVPIDNPAGTRYATYAARTGETVNISVYLNGVLQPLMNTSSIPPVGESGNAARLDLNIGEDTDHDGMSDQWETMLIIDKSEGRYTTVEEVLPGDDFDGDGESNLNEFYAGTAPELAGDVFQVYQWMKTTDGLLALRFLTVKGTTYLLNAAPSPANGEPFAWKPTNFQTTKGGTSMLTYTAPATDYQYFYVQAQTNVMMFQLELVK